MKRTAALAVACLVTCASAVSSARADRPSTPAVEGAAQLATPPPGFRHVRGGGRHEAEAPWDGPRVEIGWMHYGVTDGADGGGTNTFTFAGWLPTDAFRLGGLVELGVRQYELGPNDAIVRAQAMLGYQYLGGSLGSLVPYAVVVGTAGVIVGKRFRTTFANEVYGLGLEIGADVRLVRTLWTGIGLGYQRVTSDGLAYDLLTLRLSIGL